MDSLTQTCTIIGVLGGLFFIFFKMLKDDIKSVRSELREDIGKLDTKVENIRIELGERITKLDGKVGELSQKVSHMDGQLSQVTQMLYFKPPVHDKLDEPKEN